MIITCHFRSEVCKELFKDGSCCSGDECEFAHNSFECRFHPSKIYSKLCDTHKSRKECFTVNPLCEHSHLGSPETFFTEYWDDSLLFGTPLVVEFLAGAIQKLNLYNPTSKDCRIFVMGASNFFLRNVGRIVNQICRKHSLKHDFVGERDVVFESEPLLFGMPSKFVESLDRLVLLPFTLIIISQIDLIFSSVKQKKALVNFFTQSKMFNPPYVQTLFVADEHSSQLRQMIKKYLNKDVKMITNPGHKVKFMYNVPCTPLTAKPKWLDSNAKPVEVYPLLSVEVEKEMDKVEVVKEVVEKPEEMNSSRRGEKRKKNKSRSRSNSPHNRRYRSRSPNRKSSSSRCLSKRSVKRPHSRQNYSPTKPSPERLPVKKRIKIEKIDRKISNKLLSIDIQDHSTLPKKKSDGAAIKIYKTDEKVVEVRENRQLPRRRSNLKDILNNVIRSPQKGKSDIQDIKGLGTKLSPVPSPPVSMFEGQCNENLKKIPDVFLNRSGHHQSMLEFVDQSFNITSLKEKFGDNLYKEFEAEKQKTCFELEEKFDVFETVPELHEKYEDCYENFMQMYKSKYQNQNEDHKEELWKKFWKFKLNFFKKTELRNRVPNLIDRFRQKIGSFSPLSPIIPDLDTHFRQSKSEINMRSAGQISTLAIGQIGVLKNKESSSFDLNYAPNNSPYLNSTPASPHPSNISNLKPRCDGEHNSVGNHVGKKIKIYDKPSISALFYDNDVSSLSSSTSNLTHKNTSPVASKSLVSIDNQTKGSSSCKSSVPTPTHIKDGRKRERTPIKESTQSTLSEDESSYKNFDIDKAITYLELIVPDIGALSSCLKTMIESSKEEGINSKKFLETFSDPDNVTLIELALMKIETKWRKERREEFYSLERSVTGLIKYAEQELEKISERETEFSEEEEEFTLDYEAIAKTTLGKDPSSILKRICTAASYKKIKLTKQQEIECYLKICSIHFNLATT